MTPIPQSPKDEALHALGRTIVNLQKIEHVVKFLTLFGPLAGTVFSVQKEIGARRARMEKFTLGAAIAEWKKVLVGEVSKPFSVSDLFDVTLHSSVSFDIDPDIVRNHIEEIESLLSDRNRLVHNDLIAIDWNNRDHCESLVAHLSRKNDRIAREFQFLGGILNELLGMHSSIKEAIDTGELVKLLSAEGEQRDA